MAKNDTENFMPPPATMPPEQGLFSSKGFVDFGVQVGQYMFHRGPTEMFLEVLPDPLENAVRGLVAKGFREIGKRTLKPETALQEAMNKKLFMNTFNEDGYPVMAEAPEGYVESLFPYGKQDDWPTQLVICTKDVRPDPAMLRQTMTFFPEIAGDVVGQPLDVVQGFDEKANGRVVVLGVYNTDQDILHNASAVLERSQKLQKNGDSVEGMSDAAIKAGDTLLAAMTLRKDSATTVLRDDAPDIFRHVMMHGYSQGGNIATDTFRHIRHELMSGRFELALDAKGKDTISTADEKMVGDLLGNSYVYTIAAADPPYTDKDLVTLPPRDNTRSDGDLVITLAVGANRHQSNYQTKWQQDEVFVERNDRLVEVIGPRKKLFGLLEPRGTGYHSMLGHGDEHYRDSVVEQAGAVLKERMLPRLRGEVVSSDVTYSNGRIVLDFERGTPPATMRETTDAVAKDLQKAGIGVESGLYPDTPYQLVIRDKGKPESLDILRDSLREHGVHLGLNTAFGLSAPSAAQWLQHRLSKLPDAEVVADAGDKGPVIKVFPTGFGNEAGPQVRSMLMRGLERVGLKTARDNVSPTVELPLEDVVHAFKQEHHKGLVEELGR